jgi:hypothetical protein
MKIDMRFDHVLLDSFRMRNVLNKRCRNTHFMFNNFFFFVNLVVCEIMRKNILEPGKPQMTMRPMHVACWIPKAINTLSEYVIIIVFLLQQWLH